MADKREISEYYAELAKEVIEENNELAYLRDAEITIIYLESQHKKKSHKKIVFAECEKVAEKNKWAVPCDFTITVFLPNVERRNFTEEQKKIVLFHELLHIGVDFEGNWFIRPHDLEDFKLIIDKFGTDWAQGRAKEEDHADAADQEEVV